MHPQVVLDSNPAETRVVASKEGSSIAVPVRSLNTVPLKLVYATADLDAAFLRNCLRNATDYRRSAGYFRSSLYRVAGDDFLRFAQDGGRIKLICSPDLRADDWQAINDGYVSRREVLRRAAIRDTRDLLTSEGAAQDSTRILAWLIANDALDIKIAMRATGSGIFHDKVGIFSDANGDRVVFNGSGNETYEGWFDHDGNHETVSVFRSWLVGHREFVEHFEHYFDTLWNDGSPELIVETLPSEAATLFKERLQDHDRRQSRQETLAGRTPLPYQLQSYENWRLNGGRGIFQYATGAGKTLASLLVLREHIQSGNTAIIVVPGKELFAQWRLELETSFPDCPLMFAGLKYTRWHGNGFLEAFTAADHRGKIVLATLSTARGDDFVSRVQAGSHLLIIADEVHETGAPKAQHLFSINAGRRLGISATPQRFHDEPGTIALLDYFGEILDPVITIPDAIRYGRLVPYEYHPHAVTLSSDEADLWQEHSRRLRRAIGRDIGTSGALDLSNSYIRHLLIQRSRVLKTARSKVALAASIFETRPTDEERWLIYCDDQLQVGEVTSVLRERSLQCYEYHTAMSGDPEETLRYVSAHGGILVSIRCLDQGVDIPTLNRALILASSSNPRQYVQRRGRVLRTAPGKHLAIIHDALVVPPVDYDERDQSALLGTELRRALEFARSAVNTSALLTLRQILIRYDIDPDTIGDFALEA